MGTYVSMLSWTGCPRPDPGDIRAAVRRQNTELRNRGLHSVAVLEDGCECTAVMIANVGGAAEAERLAAAIYPDAILRIDSMRFDDDPATPNWSGEKVCPPPPRDYLSAVLDAVAKV